MLRHRFATAIVIAGAGFLALGLLGPAALADTGTTAPAPAVTQSAGTFTVSLPGVGSLTFMVDPATGAVSNLVATADPSGSFTAGTPVVTDEGVQVTFTGASGATDVLKVEVEREDGAVKVSAESEGDQHDAEDHPALSSTTSTTEHDGDLSERSSTSTTTEVEHEGETSTTVASAEHEGETSTTSTTSTDGHDGSGDSSTSTTSGSGGGD